MDQTPKVVPVAEKFAGTVLLVDDERIVRELGKEILTQMGFEVLLAADGQEGLDLFEKNVNGINLVLLDIAMPRLDGVGVLNRIREKSAVPVIMATGYSLEQVAAQFEKIANVGLIQKPYSQQELREKIRQAFSH
jgi:CheY-like chemotaxis protein